MFVEEKQRRQGLILRGPGDVPLDGQMDGNVTDVLLIEICWMREIIKANAAQPNSFASVFDGLCWAVAPLTTGGYGDVYPVTAGGRVFTFIVLMIGLGVVAVPTGLVASALSKAREEEAGVIRDSSLRNDPSEYVLRCLAS